MRYTGVRVGEADIPRHNRRGPRGFNQRSQKEGTQRDHIRIRSHNVGSIRSEDSRNKAVDANVEVIAFQETFADVKDMRNATKDLDKKQIRVQWSDATKAKGAGSGAMVAAAAPLYSTPLVMHTLDADMAEVKRSTRLAAAWIQTNGVDNGIVVISYYVISGANAEWTRGR